MKIFRGIKNFFHPVTDYKKGTDLERHKETVGALRSMIERFFIIQKARHVEDFEHALQRMHLTEQDVIQRRRDFMKLTIIMLLVTLAVFAYFLYHLVNGQILGMMVSFVLTLLCIVLTFRYHFWYFQLKQRKLGCTFKEWFYKGLLGR